MSGLERIWMRQVRKLGPPIGGTIKRIWTSIRCKKEMRNRMRISRAWSPIRNWRYREAVRDDLILVSVNRIKEARKNRQDWEKGIEFCIYWIWGLRGISKRRNLREIRSIVWTTNFFVEGQKRIYSPLEGFWCVFFFSEKIQFDVLKEYKCLGRGRNKIIFKWYNIADQYYCKYFKCVWCTFCYS